METTLHILHLEDEPHDSELVLAILEREKIRCKITRVDTRPDFLRALEKGGFDLIFSDNSLPTFDGMSALTYARKQCPKIPFIFISGTLGEEVAIESLKNGATDYVLKQRMSRLVPAVKRALQEVRERKKREAAEQQIHLQLQRLNAIRKIDIAITANLDLKIILKIFLKQLLTQLHVDAAAVLFLHPGSDTLECIAAKGFRHNGFENTTLQLKTSAAGKTILRKRVMHVPHLSAARIDMERSVFIHQEGFCSYCAVPLFAKRSPKGVLEIFHRQPLNPDPAWHNFLKTLARQACIAIDNSVLFSELQRSNFELTQAYDRTLEGWSRALDLRDKETEGHTLRVTEMTVRLAEKMGFRNDELVHIRRGALLHDIGKMGIPDHILHKPGKLNENEWQIMRLHPVYAYEMLSPIRFLEPAIHIPYCHHEKWDGSGYPQGLKGKEIPRYARLFCVIDVWDALRSDRPYRTGWPLEQVCDYIREKTGEHFDPEVAKVFLETVNDVEKNIRRPTATGAAPTPASASC